ncbi:MAG: folate family ECF transporter S component [Christensenellaceae bacterium]|nr:folate family ECF transporter S component [Christensenellaceae bacterium]
MESKKPNVRFTTRKLVLCALLTALGVVLGGLLNIPAMPLGAYTLKIGMGMLPVLLAAVLYGPLYGGIVGGLTDLLQALIFPKGAYMPWFTVIGILFGILPGLFFSKGQEPKPGRLLLAVGTGQVVCSVVLNTLLLMWIYGSPYQIVYARIVNQAVMIPLYTLILYYLIGLLRKSGVI